jgi:hypothetical protein
MKIGLLLGMGLDGGGPCKHVLEFQKVFPSDILYTSRKEKKWIRGDAHPIVENGIELSFATDPKKCLDTLREYDLIIIFTMPHHSHPEITKSNFLWVISQVKSKKIALQLSHTMNWVRKTVFYKAYIGECDAVISYDENSPYGLYHKQEIPKIPLITLPFGIVGLDFQGHREKYWQSVGEQQDLVRWIGRSTSFKKGPQFIKFCQEFLKDETVILEGLEPAINYKSFLEGFDVENYFRPKKTPPHGEEQQGKLYLYPPYNNDEALVRMGFSAIGAETMSIKHGHYGNSIEFCQSEIVACGAVPLFNYEQCKNIIHRRTGNPVTKDIESGTLFFNAGNDEKLGRDINTVLCDQGLRYHLRENAYDYWSEQADGETIYKEMMEAICKM